MYKIEVSVLSKENYQYKTQQSVRIIGSVYVILTVVTILALYLAGMPLFDAVNHAFTIVATGGLSTKNLSIAHYNSPAIEAVCAVMMLISSLHFGLLYLTVAKRSLKIFKSPIIRFYLGSLWIVTVLVTLNLRWEEVVTTWGQAFRYAAFHVISFASTCGLANADSSHWPLFSIFLLMYISMQCACSGSTTGGIKVDRVWILLQSFRGHLRKMLHPNAVIPIKIGNHVVDADFVSRVSVYVLMYILCIFLGALLLSMTGLDLMDSLSASIASMGNVGPGFGSCGALDSFAHFSAVAKFVLALQMLFGRLEIFALLLIFVIFKRNA
jgi:trk system potassium uptake protein TrkH